MKKNLSYIIQKIDSFRNGIDPYSYLSESISEALLSKNKIIKNQNELLIKLLNHARNESPYYKNIFDHNGIMVSDDIELNILNNIPILTKNILKENIDNIAIKNKENTIIRKTSGSTGQPLKIYNSINYMSKAFANKFRCLSWYGLDYLSGVGVIWGGRSSNKINQQINKLYNCLINRVKLDGFDLGHDKINKFVNMCSHSNVSILTGYTSALNIIAESILDKRVDIGNWKPFLVMPTGEVLWDFQRKNIEEAFCCTVSNEYGGCENLGLAYECPYCGFMHISHEDYIVEYLDSGINDKIKKIVITSLKNYATPLIRYENGDLVEIEENVKCIYYNDMTAIKKIYGRNIDIIVTSDGCKYYPALMTYAAKKWWSKNEVSEWQAIQNEIGEIDIYYVKGINYNLYAIENFRRQILKDMNNIIDITMIEADKIRREKSGKFRYFKSNIYT